MFGMGSNGSPSLMRFDKCNKNVHPGSEGNSELQYVVAGCVLFVKHRHNNNYNNTSKFYKVDCEKKGEGLNFLNR